MLLQSFLFLRVLTAVAGRSGDQNDWKIISMVY